MPRGCFRRRQCHFQTPAAGRRLIWHPFGQRRKKAQKNQGLHDLWDAFYIFGRCGPELRAMGRLIRSVRIVNPLGLHARAAAGLAAVAGKARGPVWVANASERADATNIIDILTLACPVGSLVTVEVRDPEDLPILERIVQLVTEGFGE